jgi:hypothetical protein
MKERLGTWGGGIKPTPFGCKADQTAPAVAITEPASGASVSRTFRVRVQASDDCEVSRVRVAVAPMRLAAESMTPPFEWTVANISGRQTITVTATDLSGKTTSTSVTVDAPIAPEVSGGGSAAPGVGDAEGFEPGGCQVAGCGLVSSRGSTTSMLAGAFLVAALVSRPAARGRARRR